MELSFPMGYYGTCWGKVNNEPWWSDNCFVDKKPVVGYVYVFAVIRCGQETMSTEPYFACESTMKLLRRRR